MSWSVLLADVMFPLGDMTKEHVRRLAVESGIPSASRRSSAGICFVGARLPIAMTPLYCGPRLKLQLKILCRARLPAYRC